MMYLLDNSGIPESRYTNNPIYPDKIDVESYKKANEWRENIVDHVKNGDNIYIWGKTTGTGKTSIAIKMLLRYFDSIWAGNGLVKRGYFVHVPLLINQIHDSFNSKEDMSGLKEGLANLDVVVFDDIGANKLKIDGYDLSLILSIVDSRVLSKKTSIYTSNIDPKRLKYELGDRLTSRILGSCEIIELKGSDRR